MAVSQVIGMSGRGYAWVSLSLCRWSALLVVLLGLLAVLPATKASNQQGFLAPINCSANTTILISKNKASWQHGEQECQKQGGHLASLNAVVSTQSNCSGKLYTPYGASDYFFGVTSLIDGNSRSISIAADMLEITSVDKLRPVSEYSCGIVHLDGNGSIGRLPALSLCHHHSYFLCEIDRASSMKTLAACGVNAKIMYTYHPIAVSNAHAKSVCSDDGVSTLLKGENTACAHWLVSVNSAISGASLPHLSLDLQIHTNQATASGCQYYLAHNNTKTDERCNLVRPFICEAPFCKVPKPSQGRLTGAEHIKANEYAKYECNRAHLPFPPAKCQLDGKLSQSVYCEPVCAVPRLVLHGKVSAIGPFVNASGGTITLRCEWGYFANGGQDRTHTYTCIGAGLYSSGVACNPELHVIVPFSYPVPFSNHYATYNYHVYMLKEIVTNITLAEQRCGYIPTNYYTHTRIFRDICDSTLQPGRFWVSGKRYSSTPTAGYFRSGSSIYDCSIHAPGDPYIPASTGNNIRSICIK